MQCMQGDVKSVDTLTTSYFRCVHKLLVSCTMTKRSCNANHFFIKVAPCSFKVPVHVYLLKDLLFLFHGRYDEETWSTSCCDVKYLKNLTQYLLNLAGCLCLNAHDGYKFPRGLDKPYICYYGNGKRTKCRKRYETQESHIGSVLSFEWEVVLKFRRTFILG